MDLKTLESIPPWDWPEGAGAFCLEILRNGRAPETDRVVAADLAGDYAVVNDDLADALLAIVRDNAASDHLRSKAAIALGPCLESADTEGFEGDDALITESTFHRLLESLQDLLRNAAVPQEVRRRILEASVRAQQDWHQDAIRAAYHSPDESWKLTAVFCMRYVRGFDELILEELSSRNPDVHYEAVCAAGNGVVDAAWSHIAGLVTSGGTPKPLLLAAVEALAAIRPEDAPEALDPLLDSDDEDIVEAVEEALSMAETLSDEDGDDANGDEN